MLECLIGVLNVLWEESCKEQLVDCAACRCVECPEGVLLSVLSFVS